ncbi:hypothetical protein GGR56DRAFT_399943 [Xylariaceae sp. FL0804]|nr:hypothetical protein GGR56DRAFT_399943 [Xylariaceae sp. FL0804]
MLCADCCSPLLYLVLVRAQCRSKSDLRDTDKSLGFDCICQRWSLLSSATAFKLQCLIHANCDSSALINIQPWSSALYLPASVCARPRFLPGHYHKMPLPYTGT